MNVDWGTREQAPHTDPAFPTLAACLAGPVPGSALEAVYYYPGRTLQAVHRLPDGRVVTVDALTLATPRPALGAGETWDDRLGAVVRAFPYDDGLPQLGAAVAECAPGGRPDSPDELLAYLPRWRAVLGAGDVVVKVGRADAVARNHARQWRLREDPRRRFRLARPLDLAPGGTRREQRLDGVPVLAAVASGAWSAADVAASLAEQVAALHALPPDGYLLADHGAARLLDRWGHKTLRTVGRALPALAPRVADVVARLAAAPPPSGCPVLVHGDFHTANLLAGPDGVTLLDLDELGTGDRELDAAVLLGRLLLVRLTTADPATAAAAGDLARRFPAAYAAVGGPLRPDVLAWYLAGTLVGRQVKTSIRHLAPGLAGLADRLVTAAEAVVDGLGPGPDGAAALVERVVVGEPVAVR